MAYTAKDAAGNTIYLDGAGTGADSGNAITPNSTIIGAVNETAPGTDTASSGLNGRLQRIAQRLTSILAKLPALGTAGTASSDVITVQGIASMTAIKVDGSAVTQPVSAASLPLPSGAATSANQATGNTSLSNIEGYVDGLEALVTSTNTKLDTVHTDLGTLLTTGAPITGQSLESGGAGGLGWLSSVRKKLSDLIALLPTALGQTTMANSLAVTIASNQSAVPVSGTVTAAASENHVGEVATAGKLVQVALTVSTSPAYTAGDSIGGKITIANAVRVSGGVSVLASLEILDRANQKPAGTIYIFNADPTNATLTDNAAFVFSTDDLKVIAQIPVSTSDYVTTNSKATANLSGLARIVGPASGTTLYAAFVTTSTPTFAATADVQLGFGFANIN